MPMNTNGVIGPRKVRSRAPRPAPAPPPERELPDQINIGDSVGVIKIDVLDVEGDPTAKDVVVQLLSQHGFKLGKVVRFELGCFTDSDLITLSSSTYFASEATAGQLLGNADSIVVAKTDVNGLFKCRITNLVGDTIHIAGSPSRGSALLDYEDTAETTFS